MPTAPWRTATYSQPNSTCVEIGAVFDASNTIKVRDSKLQESPILDIDPDNWMSFLASIRQ